MRRLVLALLVSGCAGGFKPLEAEGSYLAEQAKCVDDHETNAEIDACRTAKRARWLKDAGR